MKRVYLDHAATTPVRPEVAEAMAPYLTDAYGNPSSIHSFGQEAKAALDNARDTLAQALGAEPAEITFTGGGSEADNLALHGVLIANQARGKHFITTMVEHEAVLKTAEFMEKMGWRVTRLPVDEYGRVAPSQVAEAITDDTVLVSVMHANNEVGTILPIAQISQVAHNRGALMHTDAVQSFGQLPVDVDTLGVDLLSLSAHKIYGPKGVGALYVRRGTPIEALIHGGGQERERRSGTENVAGIVGFAEATRLMLQERDFQAERQRSLRDRWIEKALQILPKAKLNGHPTERLPNNINISVEGVEGEAMLLGLDLAGVAASSGSACASGSIEPSHVLLAMGIGPERVRSALRLTLGRSTTEEDLAYALDTLKKTATRLREMTEHNISTNI
jgi:cysteine desulfurase